MLIFALLQRALLPSCQILSSGNVDSNDHNTIGMTVLNTVLPWDAETMSAIGDEMIAIFDGNTGLATGDETTETPDDGKIEIPGDFHDLGICQWTRPVNS